MASTPFLLSALFLFTLTPSLRAQQRCPPGEIISNGACEQCPIGTFRSNRNTCTPCRAGTSQPHTGAVAGDLCRECTPGTYSDEEASPTCKPCPKGTTSNFAATKCSPCGPGTRAVQYGNGCEQCQRGSYSTDKANLRCEYCPWPLSSKPGSTSQIACKPCPPGRHSNSCAECSENFFKEKGKDRCSPCPAGTFTMGIRKTSESQCIPCPKNTFISPRADKCKPCKKGTIANGPGAMFCRTPGQPCANDFFENENGDCMRCPRGWVYVPGEKRCERCPSGSVSRGGKQTECVKCTGLLVADLRMSRCQCPQGMFMKSSKKCIPCPAGTDIVDDYHTHKSCFKCDRGTFKKEAGTHLCERCPYGLVALKEGATECSKCPEGTMPDMDDGQGEYSFGSGLCVSPRTRCPPGYRRRSVGVGGSFFGCQHVSCALDTPKEEINVTCAPCRKGERILNGRCRECPRKEVSPGGVISSCTACENGLFQDERDRSKCSCYGYFALGFGIQNGVCSKCPAGRFGAYDSEVCQTCPPGTFAQKIGSERCKRCPPGTVATGGASVCEKCPMGTIPERRNRARRCVPQAELRVSQRIG